MVDWGHWILPVLHSTFVYLWPVKDLGHMLVVFVLPSLVSGHAYARTDAYLQSCMQEWHEYRHHPEHTAWKVAMFY